MFFHLTIKVTILQYFQNAELCNTQKIESSYQTGIRHFRNVGYAWFSNSYITKALPAVYGIIETIDTYLVTIMVFMF